MEEIKNIEVKEEEKETEEIIINETANKVFPFIGVVVSTLLIVIILLVKFLK